MELEFDKEIDSLLRKADRGVLVGDKPGGKPGVHLDADQLSAFAENAMPQHTRALHMAHLADCDRCRRILSGLIALNAEAEPAERDLAAPAISVSGVEPWYRRFLLPNLAYVMGGLVLMFGGLIAISLLRSPQFENAATISQSVANTSSARGPMEPSFVSETDNMANSNAASTANTASTNSAGTTANAASNTSIPAPAGKAADPLTESAERDDDGGVTTDGVDAKPSVAAAAPAPMPPPPAKDGAKEEAVTSTVPERARDEAKARSVKKKTAEGEKADTELAARQAQDIPRTQAGGVAKATPGPSREGRQTFPNRADNTFEMYEEKRVGGKSFQHRDNVWYDKAYRGQATTNVRRQTDEYRKLDTGLRTIAESLSGVVVVVWKEKAYRIQ